MSAYPLQAHDSYRRFSAIYDEFMGDAPYEQWLRWFGEQPGVGNWKIADIGCGTGVLTVQLVSKAAWVYGVDASEEMLTVAAGRASGLPRRLEWLCQDMRELRLPTEVDVVLSTCDCMNYLLAKEDVARALVRFHEVLPIGGRLCFDILGPARIPQLANGCSYDIRETEEIWFATDVTEAGRISYLLHGFMLQDKTEGLYDRIAEEHEQQYYPPEVIQRMVEEAGFEVQSVTGDFGLRSVDDADRVVFTAVKVR